MYQGRDMHIMSAVNLRINGKHVRWSADRLAWIDCQHSGCKGRARSPQWARLSCGSAALLWQF